MIAGRPLKRKNGALTSAVLEEDLGIHRLFIRWPSSEGLPLPNIEYGHRIP